jgi:hypothetical protein
MMEQADLRYWRKHHPLSARVAYVGIRLVHNVASAIAWSVVWLGRPAQRDRAGLKVLGNAKNTLWILTRRRGRT